MSLLLAVFAITVSILAIFINQWVTFLPQIGIRFQYHRRWAQVIVAVLAISLSLVLYLANPSPAQLVVLIVVLLLTPLSGFNHAGRFLVVVDRPLQAAADEVGWDENALVIGYANQAAACAWLLSTLIPHHLINDLVAEQPVLVAW